MVLRWFIKNSGRTQFDLGMKFCTKCGSRLKPAKSSSICARCGATEGSRKANFVDHFPFKSMRPFQKEVLEQIEAALASAKKFLILEAPVGFGKSAVAAALCNYLGSAYLLTSTKQLQDQYYDDFSFSTVIGKSNFTCCVPTSSGSLVACNKGRCEVDWELDECPHYLTFEEFDEHKRGLCTKQSKCEQLQDGKLCPYYRQKWDAFRAPVAVANYPFLLSELRYTNEVKHRRILVCDEVHDLEKHLVSFASFSLKRSMLASYQVNSEIAGVDIPDTGSDDAAAWLGVLSKSKGRLDEFVETYLDNRDMQDRVASCKSISWSLENFIEDLKANPNNWVVNGIKRAATLDGDGSVEEVSFQPIEVSHYTSQLFATADTILLMSATIFSKELLCRTLGIMEDAACFIRVPNSSFPVENRIIYGLDTAHLSRGTMDASLERIAITVDEIMTRHSGERGVIHTTSYQQVNYIMEHVSELNRARLVTTQGSNSRSALLRTHGSSDASVLISPSLYDGVDLKDELSRFQIIVKVPYPDLSDRRTSVKLERDRGWYEWQTALRLVQTYGRSVRSETDYATTYVLDSNLARFVDQHRELFPAYFLEALKVRFPRA